MEFTIQVEGRRSLAAQVYGGLRDAIIERRLRPGERLPSSREFARQLRVSRNTVTEAYARLTSEGYLATTVGSGTYVSDLLPDDPPRRPSAKPPSPPRVTDFARRLAVSPQSIVPRRDLPYDLRPGLPELAYFPIDTWRRITARHLRKLSRSTAYYGDPAGQHGLRAAISRYLAHARAVISTAEDIVISSGTQQALDLIARVLIEQNDVVAMEDPGYPAARAVFRAMGAKIHPVPVDAEGLRVDLLPDDARLVYVTPSHQFPLGVPLSLGRRGALLEWAASRRAVIIEDDYDSEFRFGGRPLESLQGLDRAGLVIYLGTFSKVLFPGLRLGYMVAPPALRSHLVAAKWITDRHTEVVEQNAMTTFMNEGHFDKYVRRMQKVYAKRQAVLLDALRRRVPSLIKPLPSMAGLHLTGLLADHIEIEDLIARAAATGIGLYSIEPFFQGPSLKGLIFGYGACEPDDIEEAVMRFANVLATLDR